MSASHQADVRYCMMRLAELALANKGHISGRQLGDGIEARAESIRDPIRPCSGIDLSIAAYLDPDGPF